MKHGSLLQYRHMHSTLQCRYSAGKDATVQHETQHGKIYESNTSNKRYGYVAQCFIGWLTNALSLRS
jgi:hypothetical protein